MQSSLGDIAPFLEDSSGYRGSAEKVFFPADVEAVRQIVLEASQKGIPLTVAGAGTGLTGARVPKSGWVLSLERFRKLEILPGRARCGVGVSLADLHREAARTKNSSARIRLRLPLPSAELSQPMPVARAAFASAPSAITCCH